MEPNKGSRKRATSDNVVDTFDILESGRISKIGEHWHSLQKWGDVSRYKHELEETGFGYLLLDHDKIPNHNLSLIEALCTFYDPETCSFRFNDNVQLQYGLLDVIMITGLNIDGCPVTGEEGQGKASDMLKQLIPILEDCPVKVNKSDGAILLSGVLPLKHFLLADHDFIKLFCLYAIGSVISPDSSSSIPKMYIPLLKHVEKIKDFAWGAAMLASFHYSILLYFDATKKRKKQEDKEIQEDMENPIPSRKTRCISQLNGPILPFIVFLCEMIPDFAKMMGVVEDFIPTKFPLMKEWTRKLHIKSRNTRKTQSKEDYLTFFGKLETTQVKLHRYERMFRYDLPERVIKQLPVAAAVVPVLNFHMEGRNFPYINCDRFGMTRNHANEFIEKIEVVAMTWLRRRGGHKPSAQVRSWSDRFTKAKDQWDTRDKFKMLGVDGNVVAISAAMDQRASSTTKSLVKVAKKKLLVFDLNGILCDIVFINWDDLMRMEKGSSSYRFKGRHFSLPLDDNMRLEGSGNWVFTRPHLQSFISFCLQHFNVAVWSSKDSKNVHSIVDKLFKELKDELKFVWTKSNCRQINCKEIGCKQGDSCEHIEGVCRLIYAKPLEYVWSSYRMLDKKNTLLIDGSPEKTSENLKGTVIHPKTYIHDIQRTDDELSPHGALRRYLEKLVEEEEIEVYVKSNPYSL